MLLLIVIIIIIDIYCAHRPFLSSFVQKFAEIIAVGDILVVVTELDFPELAVGERRWLLLLLLLLIRLLLVDVGEVGRFLEGRVVILVGLNSLRGVVVQVLLLEMHMTIVHYVIIIILIIWVVSVYVGVGFLVLDFGFFICVLVIVVIDDFLG